jgi:hypothetical protein
MDLIDNLTIVLVPGALEAGPLLAAAAGRIRHRLAVCVRDQPDHAPPWQGYAVVHQYHGH